MHLNLKQLESEEVQLDAVKTPEKPSAFIQEVAGRKPQETQMLKFPLKQGLPLKYASSYLLHVF